MSSNISSTSPEEISLRDSLNSLLQKWWLIGGIFIGSVALAVLAVSIKPNQYEARTRLLIVPRISQAAQVGNATVSQTRSDFGPELSVETLSTLATARDLMQAIVTELNRKDSTGNHWSVERLAGMLYPTVETAGRAGAQTSLPLLTMTVRGDDPKLVKNIAETWGKFFLDQNAQLLATEAARSFEFLAAQYLEVDNQRQATQREMLEYSSTHPVGLLQSQLRVQTKQYEDFLAQLEAKRAQLISEKAQLQRAQQEFAGQPEFILLKRSVSNDALISIIANNPNQGTVDALRDLTVTDQEPNPLYTSLRNQVGAGQITIARLTAEIDDLSSRTSSLSSSIVAINNQLTAGQAALADFDRKLELLNTNSETLAKQVEDARLAKAEQRGIIRIIENAVEPNTPIAKHGLRIIAVAAVMGMLLGVLTAIIVNYLQTPPISAKKS